MHVRYLAVLFLCGCGSVPAPESPGRRALNSCFFAVEQKGWLALEAPPANASELKALIPSRAKNAATLEDGYEQMWFRHADGRLQVCSLFAMGNYPAVCTTLKYEFVHGTKGWVVKEEPLVVCY